MENGAVLKNYNSVIITISLLVDIKLPSDLLNFVQSYMPLQKWWNVIATCADYDQLMLSLTCRMRGGIWYISFVLSDICLRKQNYYSSFFLRDLVFWLHDGSCDDRCTYWSFRDYMVCAYLTLNPGYISNIFTHGKYILQFVSSEAKGSICVLKTVNS